MRPPTSRQDKPGVRRMKDPCSWGAAGGNYFPTCGLCHLSEMSSGGCACPQKESRMCPFHITEISPLSQWSGWQLNIVKISYGQVWGVVWKWDTEESAQAQIALGSSLPLLPRQALSTTLSTHHDAPMPGTWALAPLFPGPFPRGKRR